MALRSYLVPKSSMPELQSRIDAVNRRAASFGAEPWRTVSSEERRVPVTDADGQSLGSFAAVMVTIEGTPPRRPGWEAVARIAWDPWAGPLVRSLDGQERRPPERPTCEHCGTDRNRTVTYIVRNDGGKEAQVGSSCVREFTGLEPAAIDWYADADEESSGWEFGRDAAFDPETEWVIALAVAAVREHGWVPASQRENGLLTTGDRVAESLGGKGNRLKPTQADSERGRDIRRIVLADGSHGEYPENLRAAISPDFLSWSSVGLAASAVSFAERLEQEALERSLPGGSEPLPVGDGVELEGTAVGVRLVEGDYGDTWKMTIVGPGWKAYSTVPAALIDAVRNPSELNGRRVSLRANVEASQDDEAFGFARRPRQARLLD